MKPEAERKSCEFCRKYAHYSFLNKDPNKRGKPVYENGKLALAHRGYKPQCHLCPKRLEWTRENYNTYKAWCLFKMGANIEPDYNAFFVLGETDAEIEMELRKCLLNVQ